MNKSNLLLGAGIFAAAIGLTAWQLRLAANLREETSQLQDQLHDVETRATAVQTEVKSAQERRAAMDRSLASILGPTPDSPALVPNEPLARPMGELDWRAGARYIDVPKELLKSIRIQIVGDNGELTQGAADLFGLTPTDRVAADELYKKTTVQFQNLERAHFEPTQEHIDGTRGGEKFSFLLHPFPEESDALKQSWQETLARSIGKERAAMVADALRNTPLGLFRRGDSWITRGTEETHITISILPSTGRNGAPNRAYSYTRGRGSGSGSGGERFQSNGSTSSPTRCCNRSKAGGTSKGTGGLPR